MSKLAWYVVIMVAIDVLLCIARFCERAAKSAKTADVPSEGSAPRDTGTTSGSAYGSVQPPSA
ncbi:MAG: hypothetical protein IKQ15_07535 [Kiritimatiellae bacterium]|nr:hypothetical protein [Kiritimatiellia bacterium]